MVDTRQVYYVLCTMYYNRGPSVIWGLFKPSLQGALGSVRWPWRPADQPGAEPR